MKRTVNCINYDDENEWRELEISSDLHVYPCCTLHALHFLDGTFYDEYLDGLPKNWNSLKHHSMDEILKIYREHITPEKWKKLKTTPKCCQKWCLKDSKSNKEYGL